VRTVIPLLRRAGPASSPRRCPAKSALNSPGPIWYTLPDYLGLILSPTCMEEGTFIMPDPALSRRKFLKEVSAGALVLGAAPLGAPAVLARGADDRITMAVIGTGGMGGGHVRQLVEM